MENIIDNPSIDIPSENELTVSSIIDELYQIYLQKFNEGVYIIPPLYIIKELFENRYPDELLDIQENYNFKLNDEYKINTLEDFSNEFKIKGILEMNILRMTSYIEDLKEIKEELIIRINNNDFLVYYCSFISLVIYVKYPFITIKNSRNKEHLIRDLFVKYQFNYNGSIENTFHILRSTYTEDELNVGYSHSHIMSVGTSLNSLSVWKTPCLGSETPLSKLINTLSVEDLNVFDDLLIMSLMSMVDAFLAWESLEGVPYIKLDNVQTGKYILTDSAEYDHIDEVVYNKIVKIIFEQYEKELFELYDIYPSIVGRRNNPYYRIVYDKIKLLLLFNKIAQENNLINDTVNLYKLYVNDLQKPEYYKIINNPTDWDYIRGERLFYFKGEEVKIKVLESDPQELDSLPTIISPAYVSTFIKNIELIINIKNGKNKFNESIY